MARKSHRPEGSHRYNKMMKRFANEFNNIQNFFNQRLISHNYAKLVKLCSHMDCSGVKFDENEVGLVRAMALCIAESKFGGNLAHQEMQAIYNSCPEILLDPNYTYSPVNTEILTDNGYTKHYGVNISVGELKILHFNSTGGENYIDGLRFSYSKYNENIDSEELVTTGNFFLNAKLIDQDGMPKVETHSGKIMNFQENDVIITGMRNNWKITQRHPDAPKEKPEYIL